MASKSIYARFATTYVMLGYSPIPFFTSSGNPPKKWSDYCDAVPNVELRRKWESQPSERIALCCGFNGLVAIDVDTTDETILTLIRKTLPHCHVARVGSKGWAMLCRYEGEGDCKFKSIYGLDNQPLVEIKGSGQNVTVPPSIHRTTGEPYYWLKLDCGLIHAERPELPELPIITESDIERLREVLKPWTRPERVLKGKSTKKDTSAKKENHVRYWQRTYDNVTKEVADTKGGRNTMLFQKACRVGLAVHHGLISESEYYDGFTEACRFNGLLADEGVRSIEATLRSALDTSASDELPELPQQEQRKSNGHANGHTNGHTEHMGNGHDKEPPEAPPPPPPPSDQEPAGEDERPIIQIRNGSLHINAVEAEAILFAKKAQLYRQSGRIVEPFRSILRDNRGDEVTVPAIGVATNATVRDTIGIFANCQKFDIRANKWLAVDPKSELAEAILDHKGKGPHWRTLAGITSTPIMRRDASIAWEHGFDEQTGIFLMDPVKLPKMPIRPNRADAKAALAILDELLREFPFHDSEDSSLAYNLTASYSVAISALLTPIARAAISVSPMHIAKAPAAGTGKSYLFNIASAIAHGTRCPVIAAGQDEEETEKRLASRILAGNSIICIDNVNGVLSGDLLAQAISEDIVAPRVLGRSESPNITNRFTIFATGNNISIKGDLNRRCIVCTMDAGLETPSERRFETDPVAMVLADRGRYVVACLTILRAHALACYPGMADLKPFNSFEDWSKVVRAALVWLGLKDPVTSLDTIRTEDPQRQERAAFVESLGKIFGFGEHHAVPVSEMIREATSTITDGREEERRLLLDILKNHGDKHGNPNSQRMGYWLRSFRNTVFGEYCLRGISEGRPMASWYIERRL